MAAKRIKLSSMSHFKLLNVDKNAKTVKGRERGVVTGILYLAPANESGVANVCPHSSPGCRASCLFTAGYGAYDIVKKARIKKTLYFLKNRAAFLNDLYEDIKKLSVYAKRRNMVATVRLNGTSDISLSSFSKDGKLITEHFPNIMFYNYTKNLSFIKAWREGLYGNNCHFTFSRSECNEEKTHLALSMGANVAVVFDVRKGEKFPKTFNNIPVVDGDKDDIRFLDKSGVIVGLRAKGMARRNNNGFVVKV